MSSKGFTLIELIIVIGIIGILSAVALFGWRGYQDNVNLRTAAREVVTDIAALKGRAVAEGIRYRITFSTSANYIIEKGTETGAPYATIQTKSLTSFGAGSGLSIFSVNFSGTQQIEFLPRGTVSTKGTMILTNSKGSRATVTVNFAGRTHVSFTMQ